MFIHAEYPGVWGYKLLLDVDHGEGVAAGTVKTEIADRIVELFYGGCSSRPPRPRTTRVSERADLLVS
jgi:hypothetical protein